MKKQIQRKVPDVSNSGKTRDDHSNKLYNVALKKKDGTNVTLFKGLTRCRANSRIEALRHMYPDWLGDLVKYRSNIRQIRNASKPRH